MKPIDYIHSLRTFGKKAGLINIAALLSRLGNPHADMSYIHVAGTNGKGSVSAMISSALIAQNKKVGLFTSPFIEFFNERIRVNNAPIPDCALKEITDRIKPIVSELEGQGIYCTVFDVICAVGFVYFKEQCCDIVVLEVGLGGRFDATNIIEAPLCSVICAIGYDHMQYLGDTLDKIAFEKCGIIKENSPVAAYPMQDMSAYAVIESTCAEKNAPLTVPELEGLNIKKCDINGSAFIYKGLEYELSLAGEYQIYNALCAIEVCRIAGVDYEAVFKGLKSVKWKCRFEVFELGDKKLVLDGAHNSHGISAFLSSADAFFKNKNVHWIFGILNEKDIEKSCELIASVKGGITVTSVPSERCTEPMAVYNRIADMHGDCVYIADNEQALEDAVGKDCDIICVLGSLYMVGALRKSVERFSQIDKTI